MSHAGKGMDNMSIKTFKFRHCRGCDFQRGPKAARRIINLALFGLVFAAVSDPGRMAHAYLDPGTGSIILQMLLGGVAGAMVVGKLYWHQFMSFFRRAPAAKPFDNDSETPPE
jgi:hypothetical protein